MSTVLVVSPLMSGHRSAYIRLIIQNARIDGWRVVLATDPCAVSTYKQEQPSPGSWPDEYASISSSSLSQISKVSRQIKPTITLVPDGDRTAAELGLRGRWSGTGNISVLVMRPNLVNRGSGLYAALRQKFKSILVERAKGVPNSKVTVLTSALSVRSAEGGYVSDPIEYQPSTLSAEEIKQSLGIGGEKFWFAILGAITERKCIPEVIEAIDYYHANSSGSANKPPALLIVGQLSVDVKQHISESVRRATIEVRVVDKRLTDQELDDAIRAVDCVVVAHRNEGPSGIVGKAAVAGARVLAAGAYSLKEDCGAATTGRKWAPLETRSLAKAANDVRQEPRPRPIQVPDVSRFWRVLSASL